MHGHIYERLFLFQELKKKKGITEEKVQLTKKQQEMLDDQIKRENEIRERLKKVGFLSEKLIIFFEVQKVCFTKIFIQYSIIYLCRY